MIPKDWAVTLWKTTSYLQLKEHLTSLQFLRTSGPAPMLYNVEPESEVEEIITEDGALSRLERRDGRRVAVRTQPKITSNQAQKMEEKGPERVLSLRTRRPYARQLHLGSTQR